MKGALDYLNSRFSRIEHIRTTERSEIWLVRDRMRPDRFFVMKIIHATGLPYSPLKDNPHPLWPEIICFAETDSDTFVVEEFIGGHPLSDYRVISEANLSFHLEGGGALPVSGGDMSLRFDLVKPVQRQQRGPVSDAGKARTGHIDRE